MSLITVLAIYDGKQVQLPEKVPIYKPYRVLVTFLEPILDKEFVLERFWASFGAWQDERPVEETLHDIHAARRSRTEPPAL